METVLYYNGNTYEKKINELKSKLKGASEEEKVFLERSM